MGVALATYFAVKCRTDFSCYGARSVQLQNSHQKPGRSCPVTRDGIELVPIVGLSPSDKRDACIQQSVASHGMLWISLPEVDVADLIDQPTTPLVIALMGKCKHLEVTHAQALGGHCFTF